MQSIKHRSKLWHQALQTSLDIPQTNGNISF